MTPHEFVQAWSAITGEVFRIVPPYVHADAKLAAEAGFTADEIRLVIAFVRYERRDPRSPYNAQSLLWRVNAANNWAKFQERLSLAGDAIKRGWRPFPAQQRVPANVVQMPAPTDEAERERLKADAQERMAALKKSIGL
jgi:hypothetical protein